MSCLRTGLKHGASLAPGESCFVDVTYVVMQADVDAGQIDNLGEVQGDPPTGPPVIDDDPATVDVPQAPALEIVKRHWSGPLLAYAETGIFETPNWIWEGAETPERYVEFVMGWIGMGVQVVGGCCGTTPDHIRRLREVIPAKLPNR